MSIKQIHSELAPKAIGPYSQGVKVGEFVFVSGQLPIDVKTGKLVQGDMRLITKQVIENLEAILKSAGSSLANVVKTEVFMTDLTEFSQMNEEYGRAFMGPVHPARQTIQVAALPLGATLEISCIATI